MQHKFNAFVCILLKQAGVFAPKTSRSTCLPRQAHEKQERLPFAIGRLQVKKTGRNGFISDKQFMFAAFSPCPFAGPF